MPPSGVDASPKPSPPRPMVDFCSGASFAALNEGNPTPLRDPKTTENH